MPKAKNISKYIQKRYKSYAKKLLNIINYKWDYVRETYGKK